MNLFTGINAGKKSECSLDKLHNLESFANSDTRKTIHQNRP